MSISKPNDRVARPAKKYIKFNGAEDDGFFSYWEKYAMDDPRYSDDKKGENVPIDISGMIVLDCDLFTVTGYNKKLGFLWSNEVRTIEDQIIARYHGQKSPAASGNWETVKSELGDNGKYTKSIYGLLGGEIVNVHVGGAGLKTWFDVIEGNKDRLGKSTIRVASIESGKQGNVNYKYPVFEFGDPIEPSDLEDAMAADSNILQPYLEKYLGGGSSNPSVNNDRTDDKAQELSWRDHNSCHGKLGNMPITAIENLIDELEASGFTGESDYDMASAAIVEYRDAKATWQTKKGKNGFLKDMELSEIKAMYDNIMAQAPSHPSRLYVEAGLQAKLAEQPNTGDEMDDDIPF